LGLNETQKLAEYIGAGVRGAVRDGFGDGKTALSDGIPLVGIFLNNMRLLYRLEATGGGIYAYARHQISALINAGATVDVLCRAGTSKADFPRARLLPQIPQPRQLVTLRNPFRYIFDARQSVHALTRVVATRNDYRYDYILLDCFKEYFAPMWIYPLKRLKDSGVRMGIINHDPSRHFQVGPRTWHIHCLKSAYRANGDIFLHELVDMTGWHPRFSNRIHKIPHGPLIYPQSAHSKRELVRRQYGFTENDFVVLSFGQIRDGKQLDKLIRAVRRLPEKVKLLVAGRIESSSQRSLSYYLKLVLFSGAVDRVVWDYRYFEDSEIAGLFQCSDAVATLYSESFVSSSGVLSSAVACNRPVIASCGGGPMKRALENYTIGEWVAPGNLEQLTSVLRRMVSSQQRYNFADYLKEHSWEENARQVLQAAQTY
jgi:glycosyltransferase involved in cell wall biosynthesis